MVLSETRFVRLRKSLFYLNFMSSCPKKYIILLERGHFKVAATVLIMWVRKSPFSAILFSMNTLVTCCKKLCWTEDSRFTDGLDEHKIHKLKQYDLAFRITFIALLAAEIAGFVLLAVGCKTPPPFHALIGLYVCVGSLVLCPIALAIINCRRDAYCQKSNIVPDQTHKRADADGSDTDSDS